MTRVAIALATVLTLAVVSTSALAKPPVHAAPGQSFKVKGKARFYLSRDSRLSIEDVRLIGPRKSKVTVPSMAAGSYRLLACTARCSTAGRIAVADGTAEHTVAFSDSRRLDENDQNLASSNFLNPSLCPSPVAPKQLPPLAGALDAAEKLLSNAAGPNGMAQFKASPAYRSAAAAEGAATEAIVVKEPGAALAALLRAHELEPDEPRYLVGAAAILTSLDHPAEALALLQGADKMPPTKSAPFGINVQALALNAKGAALLALGRFEDAERYLRGALDIEPLLAEARTNLSIALMCRQEQPDAVRFLRAGLRRQTTIAPDGSLSVPPIEDQFDTSHGVQASVPTIPIPGTFMEMKGSTEFYRQYFAAHQARQQTMRDRDSELYKLNFGNPSLLSQQRVLGLLQYALFRPDNVAAQDANLRAVSEIHGKVLALAEKLGKDSLDWAHAASVACNGIYTEPARSQCYDRVYNENCTPPMIAAHTQFTDWIREMEKSDREYIEKVYPWESAVIANISNPLVHEHWMLQIQMKAQHAWSEPFMAIDYWVVWLRNQRCGTASSGYSAPIEAPATPASEACPQSVRGVKLAWKVEAFTLEVSCEKVSLEAAATVEGWFGVFGQLDWSPRSGKMTIFAGPKASGKIPGTSIGGSFKDGLYVSVGKDGYVADFGFRTSVSGNAGFGPFAIKGSESMDFSFAPVFGIAR